MLTRSVTAEDLAALERERDEADARYNEALTAVDRALPAVRPLPAPPPPPDERRSRRSTSVADRSPDAIRPPPRGLRTRLARFVWRLVAPAFERQQAFNSALVDHVNRNVAVERETVPRRRRGSPPRSAAQALGARRVPLAPDSSTSSSSRCFVDTKDRLDAGEADGRVRRGAQRRDRRVAEALGIDGRARAAFRRPGRRRSTAAHDETPRHARVLQQATHTLKRELERLRRRRPPPASRRRPAAPRWRRRDRRHRQLQVRRLRGSLPRDAGRHPRAARRLPAAASAARSDVLDVGCGRGEFLDLLRERGIGARGLDLNHEMVEVCRARGLDARRGRRARLPARTAGRVARRAVRRAGGRAPRAGLPVRALDAAYHGCGRARPSCSRRSTRRAGSRSSRATSATSRTCGRSTPTRCSTCSPRAASSRRDRLRAPLDAEKLQPIALAADASRRAGRGGHPQRERRPAEPPPLHAPRLRRRRDAAVTTLRRWNPWTCWSSAPA